MQKKKNIEKVFNQSTHVQQAIQKIYKKHISTNKKKSFSFFIEKFNQKNMKQKHNFYIKKKKNICDLVRVGVKRK